MYEKVKKNAPNLRPPIKEEQIEIAQAFSKIGKKNNITIHACCEKEYLKEYGLDITGCMSQKIVEKAIKCELNAPKNNSKRVQCNCLMGNDIGAYNSCMHLCKYCYANANQSAVKENIKKRGIIMEQKLNKLFLECVNELKNIKIDILNEKKYGKIEISISKRNNKRYGCCKQEEPDKNYKIITKYGRRKIIKYEKFNKHHIEISKWVLELEDNIIKNTIMHELIHCLPYCNNHGEEFRRYANLVNMNYGYDVSRVGDKKKDFEKSNLEYKEIKNYNYKIKCKGCGQEFYRQRLSKNFIRKYRCAKCGGTFEVNIL